MTLHEKLALVVKSIELEDQGKIEEAEQVKSQLPLAPYLAKFAKEYFGADFFKTYNWNLTEAEAEFGSDWLAK
jgi:hypothetical protein